jgi:hypothetical protein
LLDCEGLGGIDAKADGFALRIEGIEVDVRDDAEGCLGVVRLELVQLLVRKRGLGYATRRGYRELRRMEVGRW